ncbi:protein FAM177A1 [Engraulis encrasicolus]|uniref:protein FAM177A1 n=1 Tax=Engraulis encrasicolus TaxID=184585 RepID=UPI002FD6ED26
MNHNLTLETCFGQDSPSLGRKTIYFSNGETLEPSDSEEEEDGGCNYKEPFSQSRDTASMSWGEYSRFLGTNVGKKSLQMCDFLGEKLARLLGLHDAKYQYAIDEFRRSQKREKPSEQDSSSLDSSPEHLNLSLRTGRSYGATSSDGVISPTPSSSCMSTGVKNKAVDTDNRGYQDDD